VQGFWLVTSHGGSVEGPAMGAGAATWRRERHIEEAGRVGGRPAICRVVTRFRGCRQVWGEPVSGEVLGPVGRPDARRAAGVGGLDNAADFGVDGTETGDLDGICCMLDAKVTQEESSPEVAAGAASDNAGDSYQM
jgi:hypothetical protein